MKNIQLVLIGALLIVMLYGIYNHFLITGMQTFDSSGLSITQCQDGGAAVSEGGFTCGLGGTDGTDSSKDTVGVPWDLPKIRGSTKCIYYCVVEVSYSQRGECRGNRWIRVYPEEVIGVQSLESPPEWQIEEGAVLDSWECKIPATKSKILPKIDLRSCKANEKHVIAECKKAFTSDEIDAVSDLAKTRTEACVENNQNRCRRPTQRVIMQDSSPVGPTLDFSLSRILR
ncbi:hypothetical protein HYT58_00900 [Candidatus Woesearchaeota archaeon]|nr:hypothetical protein [Candidatus Woesearchaeota archaeon]